MRNNVNFVKTAVQHLSQLFWGAGLLLSIPCSINFTAVAGFINGTLK